MNCIQILNRSPKETAKETDSLTSNYGYGRLSYVEKKLPWFYTTRMFLLHIRPTKKCAVIVYNNL
jgi:hypothetical protein